VSARLKPDVIFPRPQPPGEGPAFPKRLLIVDPDRKAWEVSARLLIAQGYLVHRIARIAEAPAQWPRHLYDLVVVATEDPANPEVVEFCQKLNTAQPPVCVVLMARDAAGRGPSATTVIACDQPAAQVAEGIARLLR
jgi:AmiR/NasT family two-component response regulator